VTSGVGDLRMRCAEYEPDSIWDERPVSQRVI
jgi:hypothetical protein